LDSVFYYPFIFAAVAFLASVTIFFTGGKARYGYLKVFSLFLLANLITEGITAYKAWAGVHNLVLSNFVTAFDFAFYLYFFGQIVRSEKVKKIIQFLVILYPVLFLINIFFIQGMDTFHSMTWCLGCLLVIIFCIYYFWELFQQTQSINLSRQPSFWICCGLLFYNACTFPFYASTNFVYVLPKVILRNLLFIFVLLNILLYLSFTIAFLCRLTNRKSMSSF